MNFFTKTLCYFAGANLRILRKYPEEIMRYSSIGTTIFFTGLFASLSGGYAAYKIFHNFEASILIGVIWGLLIFNLDRYIVMSLQKKGDFLQEFLTALPRILLAIMISFVIAKPLEIRIFEDRIASVIDDKKTELKKRGIIDREVIYGSDKLSEEILNIEDEISELEKLKSERPKGKIFQDLLNEKEALENTLETQKNNFDLEQSKVSRFFGNYTVKKIIDGKEIEVPATRSKDLQPSIWQKIRPTVLRRDRSKIDIQTTTENLEANRVQRKNELKVHNKNYNEKISAKKEELKAKKQEKVKSDKESKIARDNTDAINNRAFSENFIAQLEALGVLTKYKENTTDNEGNIIEVNNTLYWVNIGIILLFIMIETAPIFVKLISPQGQYDIAFQTKLAVDEAKEVSEANIKLLQNQQAEDLELFVSQQEKKHKQQALIKLLQKWETKTEHKINSLKGFKKFQELLKKIITFKRKG